MAFTVHRSRSMLSPSMPFWHAIAVSLLFFGLSSSPAQSSEDCFAVPTASCLAASAFDLSQQADFDGAATETVEAWSWAVAEIAVALDAVGRTEDGAAVLQRLIEPANEISNFGTRSNAISRIAQAYARMGLVDEAMAVTDTLDGTDSVHGIRMEIVSHLAIADEIAQATEIAELIEGGLQRDWAMSFLAVAYGRAGQVDPAMDAVAAIQMPEVRATGLRQVALALCANGFHDLAPGFLERAIATWDEASPSGSQRLTGDFWITFAFAECGLTEQALERLARAADEIAALGPGSQQEQFLSSLADGYARAGMFEAAEEAVLQIPAGFRRESAYQRVANACLASGQTDRAIENMQRALDVFAERTSVSDWAIGWIVGDLAAVGMFESADDLVRGIEDPQTLMAASRDIALSYVREGMLGDAVATAILNEEPHWRAMVLASIVAEVVVLE